MIFPTVHLNGTSAASLIDDQLEAAKSLREALAKLDASSPNARDYYVQGNAAFGTARDEHLARRKKIEEVLSEVYAIAMNVSDQT